MRPNVPPTVKKLLLGKNTARGQESHDTLKTRWANVRAIWNNDFEEDAGLEKVVRLILAISLFLFPGVYVRWLFWRKGAIYQDLAMEAYILLKTMLPAVVLYEGWWDHPVVFWSVIWLTTETLLYIPTLIFASDALPSPRSFRRSNILIFLNYIEVVQSFAMVHMAGQYMNQPIAEWTDAIYLSFMITSTIGFGEYYPVSALGKLIVSVQSIFYLSYIALFISFFNMGSNRGGYFQRQREKD
ncbi:MAG: two pore domain potassium channel family protein [Flavobacteriales bacterium]|nr:two pore domain potassium channel family protein [Flavobacteriales bacterium]